MCSTRGSLTVYFDDPFWVGVFEITMENMLSAAKITFGSEPKDAEVLEFVLKNYYALHFSPPTAVLVRQIPKNPKKLRRSIGRTLTKSGCSTKSQQALNLGSEQNETERKIISREQKLSEEKRLYELRRKKRRNSIAENNLFMYKEKEIRFTTNFFF